MPPNTSSSSSNPMARSPPPSSPIPVPGSSSRKRAREPLSNGQIDENGDIDMHQNLTRTPMISPDPFHGSGLPTINNFTGQQDSPEKSMFEAQLEEGLVTGKRNGGSQNDGPGEENSKRQCVREDPLTNVIDFATHTPSTALQQSGSEAPRIDEYSRILGVGWTRIRDDPDVLAATRGFCRYIEKHYPLTGIEILVKGRSLDAYLVKTSQGYFLFKDDLSEGKLVAKEFNLTLIRLSDPEIRYDGESPIRANSEASDNDREEVLVTRDMEMSDIA